VVDSFGDQVVAHHQTGRKGGAADKELLDRRVQAHKAAPVLRFDDVADHGLCGNGASVGYYKPNSGYHQHVIKSDDGMLAIKYTKGSVSTLQME
jgi:hypothetical protein